MYRNVEYVSMNNWCDFFLTLHSIVRESNSLIPLLPSDW